MFPVVRYMGASKSDRVSGSQDHWTLVDNQKSLDILAFEFLSCEFQECNSQALGDESQTETHYRTIGGS